MSRSVSRQSYEPMEIPLIKVNELINSIFAMNQGTVVEQLGVCSKIGGQLLQNELINHISSLKSAKLLCYELVLMIAEENAFEGISKISSFENSYGKNKNVELSTSIRCTLALIDESLKGFIENEQSKKKGGTEKYIGSSPFYQAYAQFKNLLNNFDTLIYEEDENQIFSSSVKRVHLEGDSSESGGENEALIEQLEEIVSKKENRIKEMTEELEELILEQKAQEDLITELESRNIELKLQVANLNTKLSDIEKNELDLQEKLRELKAENYLKDREFNLKNFKIDGSKVIKTNYTDWQEDQKTEKKESRFEIDEKSLICQECEFKKSTKVEEFSSFKAMLLAQALSIEALII